MNILNKEYLDIRELGLYAREVRLRAGLSQKEIAKLIGSSQPNVSAAEKGESTRYIFVAINIIRAAGNCAIEGPFYKIKMNNDE